MNNPNESKTPIPTPAPFNYATHVAELEAGIPAAVAALENAFSLSSTCAAETFEETLSDFADKAKKDGNGDSLRQLISTLHSLMSPPVCPLTPCVSNLRAAIAYAETRNKGDAPFALIPYADAIAAGVPFAETLVHEGNDWAVFVMGDASPEDLEHLEQAGVIDAENPLTPCVSYLREYIRHEDRNGYCNFEDEGDWSMGELTATLRGYFESFVVDARDNGDSVIVTFDSIPNYEDRLNTFAVIERAEHFGNDAYSKEFLRLAPYILRNVYSE